MKNKIISLVLLSLLLTGFLAPTFVQAEELNEINYECDFNEPQERFVISNWLLTAFIRQVYTESRCAVHAMQRWSKANPSGYSRYVKTVNEGRHCHNMCPKHIRINPYDYGFKKSYLCHH